MNLRPANAKARALLKKLQALAERGIEGERIAAQIKLARLKARFDFGEPAPAETDLFSGNFKRASKARWVYTFASSEFDVANSVKWAIESATKIPCVYRNGELLAEATVSTAKRLEEIAIHIAHSFRALLEKFGPVDGVNVHDRGVFVMGLYDGMMNEMRDVGQRLPSRASAPKTRGRKKKVAPQAHAHGLHIHPYTVGLSLGQRIRFSVPLEEITAELDAVTRKHLPQ
jgi:hypothetical protein